MDVVSINLNSPEAMFAAILEKLGGAERQLTAVWSEIKEARKENNERFEQHAKDIRELKEANKLHDAKLKWGVAIIAVLGWGINAYISWKRGS
jgi:hypothetical protein